MIDVKDFGVGGDGTGDDTVALQKVYDAAKASRISGMACGPTIYHPAGIYNVNKTLNQGPSPLIGDGPFSTYFRWNGPAGGTMFERHEGRCGIKGFRLMQGDELPGCYIDWRGQSIDWGDVLEDVYFGSIHSELGIAQVQVGALINVYWKRLRFDGGAGYSIIVDTGRGPARPFNLEDFAVDFSANSKNKQGFIKFLIDRNAAPNIRLANARLESKGGLIDPGALIVLEEKSPRIADSIPAHILLENVTTQWRGSSSVIHQDFASDSPAVHGLMLNCKFIGPEQLIGGSWPDAWIKRPTWPSNGLAEVVAFGRHPSGGRQVGEWQFWQLEVDKLITEK